MRKKPPHRISFQNRDDIIDLPNLIEVQIKSYDQFLQADTLPHERENFGLQEVFTELFPIRSYDEKTTLEYLSYTLGVPKRKNVFAEESPTVSHSRFVSV